MRERLFQIIEKSNGDDTPSRIYDIFMITTIIVSLIPLAFKKSNLAFDIMDKAAMVVFIIDYIMRWATADFKFGKKSVVSFLRYPFSGMAIIDLLSILPSLTILSSGFKVLRVLRMIRALRVLKMFKIIRYSDNFRILSNVLKNSKKSLMAVGILAIGYILFSGLIIFNVEPESFKNFFEAIYWATVSLTTVGYGDIYPITTVGRIITMISSILGIAVVALPSGIITAGYLKELEKEKKEGYNAKS